MTKTLSLGVSFSLHRCSELGLDKQAVLKAALEELGFRRFRLMSYWNIHESKPGQYNFSELDWQMDLVAKYKGRVSLCIGKRQPRWPECHIPKWAAALPKEQWYEMLHKYIEVVVKRYKDHPALASWQLENEAFIKNFGYCVDNDYSYDRLKAEYKLVKSLDPRHPVIMTLSDSYGIPLRGPNADMYGMSLYRTTINKRGRYAFSVRPPLFYKVRAGLIRLVRGRSSFIHELQAEPWLPQELTKVPLLEQLKYMSPERIQENINFAKRTGQSPIDLWGLEWWYWLKEKHNRAEVWDSFKLTSTTEA